MQIRVVSSSICEVKVYGMAPVPPTETASGVGRERLADPEKFHIFEDMKKIAFVILMLLAATGLSAQEQYGVVRISVCNMRRTPDFDAEMVSQALLGTPVHILRINPEGNRWPEIQSPEGYTGWVHSAGIQILSKEAYSAWNAAEKVIVTALTGIVYEKPSVKAATLSDVVGGDRLKFLGTKGRFFKVGFPDGREGYLPKRLGERESEWRKHLDQSAEAIIRTAKSMVGFPYLWAGMSPKGMDCSGFVRTVLYMHDIIIPRDASQQAPKGERILIEPDCSNLVPGDLLFFGRRTPERDRVSHVAIYIGNRKFIHSLGLVQIASLNPDDPDYDAYDHGRLLYASRILPYIDRQEGLNTTATNPYYNE